MTKTDCDIAIVGGGLVGASLACALAPTGLRVVLVEAVAPTAAEQPSFDDRTITLAYGSRRILEGIGLWDAITRGELEPVRQIHISDRGRFGFARLNAADVGIDALGYVVPSRALGAAFYQALSRWSNITLLCPAELRAAAFDETYTHLTIRHNDTERVLTTHLVVAADGADSPVRAAAGIAFERIDYGQTAIVTMAAAEKPHAGTAFERFTDGGPLALLPAGGNRTAVVWTMRTEDARAALAWDDETFRSRLEARFGERLGRFVRVGGRHAYPLFLTRVREHVRARLALIGNAAHTVHPVAGQGFNLGLRDVAALSQILTDAAGRNPGDSALLQRYADWRARDNRFTAGFTHSLVRVFSNDYFPLTLTRNLGLIAIDLCPPLKRRFIRLTSGLAGHVPGGGAR